jgi:hypothetical protein
MTQKKLELYPELQGSDFLNFYEESELEILYFYEKFTN